MTTQPSAALAAGSDVPDGTLVRQVCAGDAESFGRLYDRHARRLYRFIAFHVADDEVAADLTQEAFARALPALSELRDGDRFGSWLTQIAHNLVLKQWRSGQRRRSEARLDADDDEDPLDLPDVGPDVETAVADRLRRADVARAASQLGEDQRAVLALRFAGGLSLAEAAAVLDRSESAVKQLQYRALVRLRQLVQEQERAP